MANSFVATGLEQLASAFVAGLWDGGALLGTIYRDAESDLIAGKGDTVTIREPQAIAAANFTVTASVSNVVEAKIAVAMDHQPYSQVAITTKEANFSIESLASQVVEPQVGGVAEYIDTEIGTLLETTTNTINSVTDWAAAVLAARGALSTAKVPMAGRYLAVSPTVAGELLGSNLMQSGNIEGAPSALADGVVGRLYGFTVVESPFVTEAVAYHRTAVAGVFRTPNPPQGTSSGSASFKNITAQMVFGYDNSKLSDVLTCQTLFGLGVSDTTFNSRAVALTAGA